jgi:site-specific recombinase XerD
VTEAVQAFHAAKADIADGTKRNYVRTLGFLQSFVEMRRLKSVDQVDLTLLEAFRSTRKINALTWTKELEILRQFFGYCTKHGWTFQSVAKDL